MALITELKDVVNTKTINFILLSIVTLGMFPILWLYKNQDKITSVIKIEITSNNYIIWIAICTGIGGVFYDIFNDTGNEIFSVLYLILTIATFILYIVWSFKAKTAIQEYALQEHKVDLRMNGFYTFLFHVFYINYCINDLPEAKRKQDVLISGSETSV